MIHKLSNRARIAVKGIINQHGWAETLSDAYEGGRLASSIAEIDIGPKEGESAADLIKRQKSTLDEVQDFEISPEQILCVKKAMKALLTAKRLAPCSEVTEIIRTFEFKD